MDVSSIVHARCAASTLLAAFFQGRLAEPNLGSGTLQQRHQFLAVGPKLFCVETAQVGYPDRRLDPRDDCASGVRELWIAGFYRIGEDDPIRKLNALDVALHVVERGPAQSQFAAIRLVAADLERQACYAVEQALRGKRDIFDLRVQIRQVSDQRIGFVADIGAIGAEQFDFNPVKTFGCVGPGIDLLIEFGAQNRS